MVTYPKSVRLLLSLSQKECTKFKDYLKSPFFNKKNSTLLKLFKQIIKDFKIDKKGYCEKKLMQQIYGAFNKRKFDFDLQKLREHFEYFVAFQHIKNDSAKCNQLVLEDYLDRDGGSFFESKYNQIKKQLTEKPADIYQYQQLFFIEELFDSYIKLYKDNRVNDSNLQAVSDAIDQDFLLKKMCFTVLMHNRQNIAKTTYDFGLTAPVLTYLKDKENEKDPLTNLFYYAYEIQTGNDKKSAYKKLNAALQKKDLNINNEMATALFMILHNNYKHLAGSKQQLDHQVFDLYQIMIGKNYIQINGKLSSSLFKNLVSIGLELDKYDYVEQLIDEYKNKLLPEEYAEQVFAYSKAKLLIYQNKPHKARELISTIKFGDAIYKFDLKCLYIMLYYDLKEFTLLEAQFSRFDVALAPKRPPFISPVNTIAYRQFILFTKKLYRLSINAVAAEQAIEDLNAALEQTIQIGCKNWLKMRVKALLTEKSISTV